MSFKVGDHVKSMHYNDDEYKTYSVVARFKASYDTDYRWYVLGDVGDTADLMTDEPTIRCKSDLEPAPMEREEVRAKVIEAFNWGWNAGHGAMGSSLPKMRDESRVEMLKSILGED
jgi:hypothetical protein